MVISKAYITVQEGGSVISSALGNACKCLFNPSEFSIQRESSYAEIKVPGLDRPVIQYVGGGAEVLSFSLFFDTYAAGLETHEAKLFATSKLPTLLKTDVREYTEGFYKLLNVNEDKHRPDEVTFVWGKIKFKGYVTDIQEKFTMFSATGVPLRATLNITIKSNQVDNNVRNSPDRTKYRTVTQGDKLCSFAETEYGSCSEWRRIAKANHMTNPRLLKSGQDIVIPPIL